MQSAWHTWRFEQRVVSAHFYRDVLNLFLQVMDEGRLSSSSTGKTVSFTNVLLIMTTNLGAKDTDRRGLGSTGMNTDGIDAAVQAHFTPEFRNRIDAIVKFNELDSDAINKIIDKLLAGMNERIKERGVVVEINKDARSWLEQHGVGRFGQLVELLGARRQHRRVVCAVHQQAGRGKLPPDLPDVGQVGQ